MRVFIHEIRTCNTKIDEHAAHRGSCLCVCVHMCVFAYAALTWNMRQSAALIMTANKIRYANEIWWRINQIGKIVFSQLPG